MKLLTVPCLILGLACCLVSPIAEARAIPQPAMQQCWSQQAFECTDCPSEQSFQCNPTVRGTWKTCEEFLLSCDPGKVCQQVNASSGFGCPQP
jgi:hypothetical protein